MEINLFQELFLSVEMWGFLGPIGLVVFGVLIADKTRNFALSVIWFVVELLFIGKYLDLVDSTPGYWWNILIILFGGLLTFIYPLLDK